jgi:hypothetical protein
MRIEKSTLTWPRAARHILLAVLGVLFALQASAQTAVEEEDFSMLDKSWKEVALKLPAAPQDGNLLPIYVGPTATQRFALDSKSISVGKDGVVRYTVVSTSAGGAKNISFEGAAMSGKNACTPSATPTAAGRPRAGSTGRRSRSIRSITSMPCWPAITCAPTAW